MTTARVSAGVVLFRWAPARGAGRGLEVLLGHPGGPFFKNKNLGAWPIPKGEPEPGEELWA
jgi:predicted NUDIX family NTP pyrophosphohydrolase